MNLIFTATLSLIIIILGLTLIDNPNNLTRGILVVLLTLLYFSFKRNREKA